MTALNLSFVMFGVSLSGILINKNNLLIMLLCIELMFFSNVLNFIFVFIYTNNVLSQILALYVITTAASETAVGLSLLTISYRLNNKTNFKSLITLRG